MMPPCERRDSRCASSRRQKQAKHEVEALRQKAVKAEALVADKSETDVDLDADMTRPDVQNRLQKPSLGDVRPRALRPPAEPVSEVEAMLKAKEMEQQRLVENNSPKQLLVSLH